MNAIDRPHGWKVSGRRVIGRLMVNEFDLLEVIDLLGRASVTIGDVAERIDISHEAAEKRITRLVEVELLELARTKRGRQAGSYALTTSGRLLYREAWDALDAACEEAA